MPDTQAVMDALNKLVAGSADVQAKKVDAATKKEAALAASQASEAADNAVAASKKQLEDDRNAMHGLIDTTFPLD